MRSVVLIKDFAGKEAGYEFTLNAKGDYLEATKDGIKIILSLNKP